MTARWSWFGVLRYPWLADHWHWHWHDHGVLASMKSSWWGQVILEIVKEKNDLVPVQGQNQNLFGFIGSQE